MTHSSPPSHPRPLHIQQPGTEALAMLIETQRAGDAAAEGVMEDDVEGGEAG